MKKSRLIALFTSVMLIISTLFMSVPAFASTTTGTQTATRLGGANRYEVAANIATTYFKTASTVILVNGADEKLADGLAATPLAKAYNAPILLTAANSIPTETQAALDTIKPSSFIVIGGPASVSDSIVTSLGATRIGGADRYEVATNVAEALKAKLGVTSFSNAVITNGAKFADALAAAPFAAKASEPVLFVTANTNDSATKATIGELGTLGITTTDAIGGSASIPDSVVTAVKGTRVNGATREDLSVAIASKYASDPAGVYAVNGYKPADALAIGPLAATTGYPVLYVNSDVKTVKAAVTDYVTATTTIKPENVVAVGGTASVSDAQQSAVVTAAIQVALAVKSVTAINATQAQVVFTQPVAGGTGVNANDPTKYSIGGTNPSTAVLQSDGKTVLLTFASATTLTGTANAGITNAVVIVEPVQSASDEYTLSPRYVTTLTYKDSVAPTVTSISASTKTTVATSFTVNFSEPVASLGSVKLDGSGVVGLLAADGLSATFTTDVSASSTHSVQFVGLADTVGNIADTFSKSFNVTVDTTAPTATVAPSSGVDNAFTITFSKDVDPSTIVGTTPVIVDESNGSSFGTPSVTQPDLSNKKVYLVTGAKSIFANSNTRTFSIALPSTIKDTLGNSFVATTKSVTLTKDSTAPIITSTKVVKDNSGYVTRIVLTSDSTLSSASLDGYSTIDSDGVLDTDSTPLGVLLITGFSAGDKTVTITPANTTVALTGKYTFNFAAGTLKDQAANANNSAATSIVIDFGTASSTGTFTIPSAKIAPSSTSAAPSVTQNADLQNDLAKNVYTVDYGTAVVGGNNTGSATQPARYTINGNALPTGTTITLDPAKEIATISIPSGTIAKSDAGAVLYIAGVKDTSGNTVVPVTTTVKINDNIQPVINSVVLNSDYSITVGTSESLAEAPVYGTDYAVYLDGTKVTGLTVTAGVGSDTGKYVITGLTSAQYNAASHVNVQTLSGATVTDAAGNVITTGTTLTLK